MGYFVTGFVLGMVVTALLGAMVLGYMDKPKPSSTEDTVTKDLTDGWQYMRDKKPTHNGVYDIKGTIKWSRKKDNYYSIHISQWKEWK